MEKPNISIEEVKKISKLSKMDIVGQEEKFSKLFTDTLSKIQVLDELNTDKVEETFQVTGLKNVFQEKDFSGNPLSKGEALSNVKEVVNNLVATKGVFIKEGDES